MPVVKGELVSHAGSIQCTVTAEVGSTLEVSSDVAGEVLSVAATGEPQELTFDLPIGAHALSIVAVDDAGNVSLASTADVEVTAPSAPRLHLLPSDPTMSLRLQVEGTDAASTRVTLSDGQVVEAFLDAAGTTVAEFAVPDGHYTIEVIVADRRGTPSVSSHLETDIVAGTVGDQGQPIPEASVDTVGPRLSVRVAKHAAEAGKLKLAIHAEAGAKVRVRSAKLDLEKRFLARSAAKTFKKQLDEGKYRFTVSATDAAGNLTIRHAKVTIA